MGFISFITQNTNRSIPNHNSSKEPFNVALLDDKGNIYEEDWYAGYGEFDKKDIFELCAEMNKELTEHLVNKVKSIPYGNYSWRFKDNRDVGLLLMSEDSDTIRQITKIASDINVEIKFPNLIEYQGNTGKNWKWINEKPKSDPNQGFFY